MFLVKYLDFSTENSNTYACSKHWVFFIFCIVYMERLKAFIRKYPNRVKYGLLFLDIFAMILTIRTYVNYISIETAIEDATMTQATKTMELAFTQNFLVHYEKSDFAQYFLEHENNMLLPGEYIIKFEEMYQKKDVQS